MASETSAEPLHVEKEAMDSLLTNTETDISNKEFLKNQKNIMENEKADLITTDSVMDIHNKPGEEDTKEVPPQYVDNIGSVSDKNTDKTTLGSDRNSIDAGAGGDSGTTTTPLARGSADNTTPQIIGESGDNKQEEIHKEDLDKNDSEATAPKPQDEWMDVLGNGKLKKKVVTAGQGRGSRPTHGEVVVIKLIGRLEDGTQVDKSDDVTFTLGDGDVIQALDLCTALMEKGEVSEVWTDAVYAYGSVGRDPDIPANSTITYTVELLDTQDSPEYAKMNVTDRLTMADQKRERGNYLYSRGEYSAAIVSYSKALKILDDEQETHKESAEELQKLVDLRMKCFNNLAATQLKAEVYDAALKSCESVLKVQGENVKALFRKGKCLAATGRITEAVRSLRRALEIEPESKIIHQELSKLAHKQKDEEKSERALYQRMIGVKPDTVKKSTWPRWVWLAGSAISAAVISVGIASYKLTHS